MAAAALLKRKRWPRSKVYIRRCTECDVLFVGRTKASKFCSLRCSGIEYNRRARPAAPKICACGVALLAARQRCDECRASTRRLRKSRGRRRRRALKLGAISENYTLAEIAARDGYRCGLCGMKVNMLLAVPALMAPTIDHVIPLSISLDDTRANVQLAHFTCNCSKSDRCVGEQLALIG